MRLTLVDNLLYESSFSVRRGDLQPHLGLMSLAAVARRCGHDPVIYDPKWEVFRGALALDGSLYEAMARAILDTSPNVIGLTALGCNFHCVVKVASRLKRQMPGIPILLGGPHATILHREILERFPAFDIVVRNEAEEILPPLLAGLEPGDLSKVPGISYRSVGGEIICNSGSPIIDDLDRLPLPAYDCYPLAQLGLDSIRIEAGRGCPFSCTFCSTASFFGRTYRLKSTPRLICEMDYVHQTYGFTNFKLNHDLFTVNRKKVAEFCLAVNGRGYTWSCSARVDCVDRELLMLMAEAGCTNIYFGIETASTRMQEISRKRLDVALVSPTLDIAGALGIETTTSFITGYPEETLDDHDQTLDMAGRLFCRTDGKNISQIHLLTPEPGTELLARYGSALRFDGHVSEFNFPMLEPGDRDLIAGDDAIFSNHHYFPSVLPRERLIFVTSAWTALWSAGRAFTDYLLRGFGGRLSRFMTEALAWHERRAAKRWHVNPDDVQAFLEARFGRRHHVTSLFRHAQAVDRILQTVRAPGRESRAAAKGDPRETCWGIGAGAVVLRDIHDCIGLLERIEAAPAAQLLADTDTGPLQHMLLVGRSPASPGGAETAAVSAYLIDSITADLLARFENPKTYWECCQEIAEEDEQAPFPDWQDLAAFCEMGVLDGTADRATPRTSPTVSRW